MGNEPRRYICERCGGSGQQVAGVWNKATEKYDAPAGVCDGCNGSGYLGVIEQPLDRLKLKVRKSHLLKGGADGK